MDSKPCKNPERKTARKGKNMATENVYDHPTQLRQSGIDCCDRGEFQQILGS